MFVMLSPGQQFRYVIEWYVQLSGLQFPLKIFGLESLQVLGRVLTRWLIFVKFCMVAWQVAVHSVPSAVSMNFKGAAFS